MKNLLNFFVILIISQVSTSQNTILWKVSDTINNKTTFIVGSFHQFGSSFVDSIPEIKASLLKSDVAIFESTDDAEDTRKVIQLRERSNDIEKKLKKKDLNQLKEITKDWKVDLYKLKPIEIRWKLQQEYSRIVCKTSKPTDKFDEFDGYVMHLAKKNNIPIQGLETNQLEVINKASGYPNWKKERKRISIWLKKLLLDKASDKNCSLANKYRNFNLDYDFDQDCELNYINFERNNLWMGKIPDIIRTQNAFIIVGYFHLKWKCGLLEQLKDYGFKVEPVEI